MSENNETSEKQPEKQDEIITAALLVIGDEILSGRTKDKNIGYIADHLTAIGIRLTEVRIVADVEMEIVDALNAMRPRYDYVFTTGGIGPTHDDITADSVAKAFGVGIDVDQRAVDLMLKHFKKSQLDGDRMRMARIPFGADLVENKLSRAPGFKLENVIVMAGIPAVMQVMLDAVTPKLKTGRKMLTETVDVHAPESEIAPWLRQLQDEFPDISMGSYPFYNEGSWGANLVLRSTDPERLELSKVALVKLLTEQGLLKG